MNTATGSLAATAFLNAASGGGNRPASGLVAGANGDMFDTTIYSGDRGTGAGPVFRVSADTGTLITLATLDGVAGGPAGPYGPLAIDANGNLYGATALGGEHGAGAIFRVAANSGEVTTLASSRLPSAARPCSVA